MANIVDLEVMCGKQHMEVKVAFDKPFNGIIFSKVRKPGKLPPLRPPLFCATIPTLEKQVLIGSDISVISYFANVGVVSSSFSTAIRYEMNRCWQSGFAYEAHFFSNCQNNVSWWKEAVVISILIPRINRTWLTWMSDLLRNSSACFSDTNFLMFCNIIVLKNFYNSIM